MASASRDVVNPWPILAFIALSTPLFLGVETVLRERLFPLVVDPRDLAEVRAWLQPSLTRWSWGLVGLSCVTIALAVAFQGALHRKLEARPRPGMDPETAAERARLEAMFLSTSLPQIPALLGTLGFTMGASLTPVAWTMALSTVGVVLLGVIGLRRRVRVEGG